MTEQELQIGVCKELRWRDITIFESGRHIIGLNPRTQLPLEKLPPLTLDLIHEAEKTLTEKERIAYVKELDWNCSDMLCEPISYSGERVNWPQAF